MTTPARHRLSLGPDVADEPPKCHAAAVPAWQLRREGPATRVSGDSEAQTDGVTRPRSHGE